LKYIAYLNVTKVAGETATSFVNYQLRR